MKNMFRIVATTLGVAALAGLNSVMAQEPAIGGSSVRALVIAERETTLAASMTGRLLDYDKRLGSAVRQGDRLVQFDCSEQKARVDMSQAELDAARLQHEAKIRLQGLESASELDVELAAAGVQKAMAQHGVAKAQMGFCSVDAPFSGRIVRWHVKPFQSINVGAPVVDLVSDNPPRIRVNVPSRWLGQIRLGRSLTVRIDETGKRYSASISSINGRVDAVSQTIEIEAQIQGASPELLPGMSGSAQLGK